MAKFVSHVLRDSKTDTLYQVELGIADIAGLRRSLSVDIAVRRFASRPRHAGQSEDEAQGIEIGATLTVEPESRTIVLTIEGEEIARIPIDDFDRATAEEAAGGDPAAAWAAIVDTPFDAAVEELIQALPAFDPVLGCLLKSSVSTTAGQVIRCYSEARDAEAVAARLRQTARCLGRNAWGMLARTLWRSMRCAGTLGTL